MTKPITNEQISELDSLFGKSPTWSGIRERLRLAEVVVEAAAADLKCNRDAFRDVLGDSDAEWLSGCPESERRLIDALTVYREACGGNG